MKHVILEITLMRKSSNTLSKLDFKNILLDADGNIVSFLCKTKRGVTKNGSQKYPIPHCAILKENCSNKAQTYANCVTQKLHECFTSLFIQLLR